MRNNNLYRSIFLIALSIGLLFLFSQWYADTEHDADVLSEINTIQNLKKQKGAHIFRIGNKTNFQQFTDNNIEWITLVSWGFQKDIDSRSVSHHDGDSANIRQHDEYWVKRIEQVQAAGFKVFLKPHLWVQEPSDGKWRSDIFPTNDKDWETWQQTYRDFIIRYAKIAEKSNAEMYCIGVEFTKLTLAKPEFWRKLIEEVRQVYSGQITYAANWYNEYENITFWEELDYIGVQAYFPLSKYKNPSTKQISKGWKRYLSDLKSVSKKHNRQIIFTEMGYKSTNNAAIKPWEWIENSSEKNQVSIETQANCYEAFFNMVWKKNWFAGVHIWQLQGDFKGNDDYSNLDFTPQGKPAETIIKKGFE